MTRKHPQPDAAMLEPRGKAPPGGMHILHTSRYGGFSLPLALLEDLFAKYPPHTPEGAVLWSSARATRRDRRRAKGRPWLHGYLRQLAPGKGGCVWRHGGPTFYISPYKDEMPFRSHPDIIAHFACPTHRKQMGLGLTFVPAGCTYHLREYDGWESVAVEVDTDALMDDMAAVAAGGPFRSPFTEVAVRGGAAAVRAHVEAATAAADAQYAACPPDCPHFLAAVAPDAAPNN